MVDKFEKKEKKEEKAYDKVKAINESKMPQAQKDALLKEIGAKADEKQEGIPFHVYVQIKKIPKTMHNAMKIYPKAKNVSLASLEEWESIFKDF